MDSAAVSCRVLNLAPVRVGKLVALASVELSVEGIAFEIHGIQVISTRSDRGLPATAIGLPMYRSADGRWKHALTLPKELEEPVSRLVLDECVERGLLNRTGIRS